MQGDPPLILPQQCGAGMDGGAVMGWENGVWEVFAALQSSYSTDGRRAEPREQLRCSWKRLGGGAGGWIRAPQTLLGGERRVSW